MTWKPIIILGLSLALCSCSNLVHVTTLPNGTEIINVAADLMGENTIPELTITTRKTTVAIKAGGRQDNTKVPTKSIAKDALLGTINGVPGVVSSLDDVLQ